jgi:hypothetical protein
VLGAGGSGEETGGAKGPVEGHEQPSRPLRAPVNGPKRIQESRHFVFRKTNPGDKAFQAAVGDAIG